MVFPVVLRRLDSYLKVPHDLIPPLSLFHFSFVVILLINFNMKVRIQAELTDRSYRAVRLYIVYKAVQKLKGTIRVESVFGEDYLSLFPTTLSGHQY